MKIIEEALGNVDGYLISIKRDMMNGWYELEIGLPKKWVFDDNGVIKCEVLNQSDAGKLIKISPVNETVGIDDLIKFVEVIIETNNVIAEKEKEFTDKMEEMKSKLELEAKKYFKELDELKENSFKSNNEKFVKSFTGAEGKIVAKRGRKPKEVDNTEVKVTKVEDESN